MPYGARCRHTRRRDKGDRLSPLQPQGKRLHRRTSWVHQSKSRETLYHAPLWEIEQPSHQLGTSVPGFSFTPYTLPLIIFSNLKPHTFSLPQNKTTPFLEWLCFYSYHSYFPIRIVYFFFPTLRRSTTKWFEYFFGRRVL